MAYIGTTPTSGDFVLLDSITTSATASYTMQRNSVNFEPQSANHMIVSLNGTIQAPVSSFTVSGSTLTFASALTSSDVIDFILVLGNVNDVGVASSVVDSAITKNKLNLISDSSSAGLTVKGDGSSENGTIQMNCSQNTHGIKLSSPSHASGQSYELIFPTGNVTADKFLKVASVSGSGTTGIGQLSFADVSNTVSFFKVYSNSNTNAQSHGSNSFVDIISQAVTPNSSSSKFLVMASVGGVRASGTNCSVGIRLTSAISGGSSYDYNAINEAGYTGSSDIDTSQVGFTHFFTHSHSGNQITFTLKFQNPQNQGTAAVKTNGDQAEIVILEFVSSDQ